MTREQLHAILNKQAQAWSPTGSRVICNPPPMDTDEDYIALMDDPHALSCAGFALGTDLHKYADMPEFLAFRHGEFNIVATDSREFYEKFCKATDAAKELNLLDKADRIALFRAVLYGERWEPI